MKLKYRKAFTDWVQISDKLHKAVGIAAKEKPFPTAADFAKAVQQVAPIVKRAAKGENPSIRVQGTRTHWTMCWCNLEQLFILI